ncbi:MAG: glycine cleavage system aminomethyltransferase GcvT [Candidatus Delongbacteria bacterium]|nr:glycine cleavage system aminomethyltransferase GcvT [Candidatus Delongbacteria bacterium]
MKRTAIYQEHLKANAKIVPFAGYEMPVQYPEGIIAEHKAVRLAAGIFDVSHMGEFIVKGPDAERFINSVITNDLSKLQPYAALYSALCYPEGTIVDDLLVYKYSSEHLMLVVNASNIEKDFNHIRSQLGSYNVTLEDQSDLYSLIALQGPKSADILSRLTPVDLSPIQYYHFAEGPVCGIEIMISRTGYTGEDGFELYIRNPEAAVTIWNELLKAGQPFGLKLCGLGARDSLRLEMGYALYGNDIDQTTTPLEAGLGWIVKLKKETPFTGQTALINQKNAGLKRKLIAFSYLDRLIPRHHYPIVAPDGQEIGHVTSGCFSPILEKSIGMGYIDLPEADQLTTFGIKIRDNIVEAAKQSIPFYRKQSKS